jgi:hypothetical protein
MNTTGFALIRPEPQLSDRYRAETKLRPLVALQSRGNLAETPQCEADGVGIEHEEPQGSLERIPKLGERRLLRSWQFSRQRSQRLKEFVRPISHGLQDDPTADALHDHFSFTLRKPAFAWKANSLAAAVLEQLCAMAFHDQKYIRV